MSRLVVVGLVVVSLAGCTATAGRDRLALATPEGYAPTVPVTVSYAPAQDLPGLCILPPERLVGCSILYHGESCRIIIAEGLSARLTRQVLEHERAHCGGWAHDD